MEWKYLDSCTSSIQTIQNVDLYQNCKYLLIYVDVKSLLLINKRDGKIYTLGALMYRQ